MELKNSPQYTSTLAATIVNFTTEDTNAEKVVEIGTTETDTDTDTTTENQTSEKPTTAEYYNKELQDFANNQVAEFANKSLNSYKKFCENAKADVRAYDGVDKEEKRLELDSFKEFFSDLKKLEKGYDTSDCFGFLEYVASIFFLLDITGNEENDPSYERNVIENFLIRHKFVSLVSEFHESAKKFITTIKGKVYEFWQKLPAEERGSEEDFEKWYAGFANYYKPISASIFSDD